MAANRTTTIILAVAGGAAALAVIAVLVGSPGSSTDEPSPSAFTSTQGTPTPPAAQPDAVLRPPNPDGLRRVPDSPPPVPEASWTRLPSGLEIFDAVVGEGASPQPGGGIKVDYTGWTDQGKVFESTYRLSEPKALLYQPGKMSPGLEEGLSDMKEGGRRILRVPPELAWGQAGANHLGIPPDSTLTWEVELVSATAARQAPEQPPAVPADGWTTTESGLRYHILTPGSGEPPAPGSVVVVEYTGWLASGKRFDSSLDRAEPLDLDLGTAMAGWAEGIGSMLPGEVRVLEVPPALAYGDGGRPPIIPGDATLTYQIELLEVR